MYTSTDTITWTARSVGTYENITAVAYLNTTYVAGTIDGNIYTSTDGTTWTARTSNIAIGNQINYLGYLNGKYYVGYSNHVAKSTVSNWYDNYGQYGIYAASAHPLYSAWTNSRSSDFWTGGIQASTDLITWTANTISAPPGISGINSIAYTGIQYITAPGGGVNNISGYTYSNSTASTFSSLNLSTFVLNSYLTAVGGNNGAVDIAYNNGYVCVVTNTNVAGGTAYNNIYVSTDTVTWTVFAASIPFSSSYSNYSTYNISSYSNLSATGTPYSVTPGPGSTFIITTNSRTTNIAYILNPVAGTLSSITLPGDTTSVSPYKHNVAYNSTNGTILFANRSGKLASGTISTTTTNTYYPSVFSLYSVNA
jgi:hypothetical protein